MKIATCRLLACLLLGSVSAAARAQAPGQQSSPVTDQHTSPLDSRIDAISAALTATQQQLEQSQLQIKQLQQQLLELRQQAVANNELPASSNPPVESAGVSSSSTSAGPQGTTDQSSVPVEERLQTLEAAVKLHDQTKVESGSKYSVRLTGLILFNGFLNKGVPDNIDIPAIATRSTSTSGNGSFGAGMRQTIIGIEGNGPRIFGAHTAADVSMDFFGGIPYTNYGTAAGIVRMRTASIDFDWINNSLQAGLVTPLISPLSPTSYATVAEPALAGAGNLWTWAPQLKFAHQFPLRNESHLQLEFGLWDSPAAGYNNPSQLFRTASPGELSQQPSYESRLSYGAEGERGLQLGVSGYYSHQTYPGYLGYPSTANIGSWAVTTDFRIPLAHHFELSGEGYRGLAIGGLGGGVYKDVIVGTDPVTGANGMRGLNAIGGWGQFKTRFNPSLETNLSIGLDNGFARDFHALVLSPTATASQLRARNKMVVANMIFRPKTYIILSPEYRRIWTWPISGVANTVDIFTLSVGYQF